MTAETRGPAPASSGPAPLIDPRLGDFESDHAAPKQRSLLAIAGSLLSEISLTKLAVTWAIQILVPAVLLGLAPLILTAWIGEASNRLDEATEIGATIVVIAAAAAAIYGWRPLFRLAEFEFLVAERARGAARLRVLARGDPASRRAVSRRADGT